jgi:single-strand DNA-binding protein
MNDTITLRGWVGTEPTVGLTRHNTPYCRFRMSVNDRRFDRERQSWVDNHTSWYNIQCYGPMAENVADSVRKGHRLIVMGRLQIRNFERADGTPGTEADLIAASVGHDLALGMGRWNRRRDEPAQLARGAEAVAGVGIVDPVTGEVAAEGHAEDPFLGVAPDFGEDAAFPSGEEAAAAYGGEDQDGDLDGDQGVEGSADTGPGERLMSA